MVLVYLSERLDEDLVKLTSTLAHECLHLTYSTAESMGDKDASEEFFCYTTGLIYGIVFQDYLDSGRMKWVP